MSFEWQEVHAQQPPPCIIFSLCFQEKLINQFLISRVSILDIAEVHPKAKRTVPIVRKVITLYKSLVSFSEQFGGENLRVADNCTFTPEMG